MMIRRRCDPFIQSVLLRKSNCLFFNEICASNICDDIVIFFFSIVYTASINCQHSSTLFSQFGSIGSLGKPVVIAKFISRGFSFGTSQTEHLGLGKN